MRTTILSTIVLLLAPGILATPTPPSDQPALIITTNSLDPGLNYTGYLTPKAIVHSPADTGPILLPPPAPACEGPTCPDCPDCGPDGQPPYSACGPSTFEDATSSTSPLASDCLIIAKNVRLGGKWNVESVTGNQHQLVQFGTCAFGVEPKDRKGGYFEIGNLDIIDIIQDSVNKFADKHGGKVNSAGETDCKGSLAATGSSYKVRWGIYHTK
ncbi:putative necrosis-inducing factor-domain-containing protein [Coniochaeta sp. 2T2.1]|nr:putative necrosis-inducing factor-domain-containing protein [Coniochaeta sp. 2T2.1]